MAMPNREGTTPLIKKGQCQWLVDMVSIDTDPFDCLIRGTGSNRRDSRRNRGLFRARFRGAVVGRVAEPLDRNEYKRRQAMPGVKTDRRAFGRDWRYQLTNGF